MTIGVVLRKAWLKVSDSYIKQNELIYDSCLLEMKSILPALRQHYSEHAAIPKLTSVTELVDYLILQESFLESLLMDQTLLIDDKRKVVWLLRYVRESWPIFKYISLLNHFIKQEDSYVVMVSYLKEDQLHHFYWQLIRGIAMMSSLETLIIYNDLLVFHSAHSTYVRKRVRRMDCLQQQFFEVVVGTFVILIDGLLSNAFDHRGVVSKTPNQGLGLLLRQPKQGLRWLQDVLLDEENGLVSLTVRYSYMPVWQKFLLVVFFSACIGFMGYGGLMTVIAKAGHRYTFLAIFLASFILTILCGVGLVLWFRKQRQAIEDQVEMTGQMLKTNTVGSGYLSKLIEYLDYCFVTPQFETHHPVVSEVSSLELLPARLGPLHHARLGLPGVEQRGVGEGYTNRWLLTLEDQ